MVALISAFIFIILIGLLLWGLTEMIWRNPDPPFRD